MKSVLSKLGVKLTKKDLTKMDEYADVNGEVLIDYRELVTHIEDATPGDPDLRQRYADMTLADLKSECTRQGLDTIGLKSDLIDRLLSTEDDHGVDYSRDDGPVAQATEWLPGEQFSARDIAGRAIDVRTKGRGRVSEIHKGFWGNPQHQVSLDSGTHKMLLRCKILEFQSIQTIIN